MTCWVIHCWTALTAVLRMLPLKTPRSWNIHQDLSQLNIDVVYGMWNCVRTVWCSVCVCASLTAAACHCTLLGNAWHVLFFVYRAWNEAISSLLHFSSIWHLQDAWVDLRSPTCLSSSFHLKWDSFTHTAFSSSNKFWQWKWATMVKDFFFLL